ncbi:hypothetical protein Tco_1249792 [Tanacetum coccineum]
MSILLHPDHGQYNTRLSPGPLCLPSVQLGRGPSVMVRPMPKSLSYPLYVIKSSQSSIVTVCSVVLRAVNIARLYTFSTARPPSSATVNFSANLADLLDYTCPHLATPCIYYAKEMDLFAFINHADPTKENANVQGVGNDNVNEEGGDVAVVDQTEQSDHVVQIGVIDIATDDEAQAIVADQPKKVRKKRKATDGASGSGLPPKKIKRRSCVTAAATVPFVTSSVTPTPEREEGGHIDSVTGPNLRTQRAMERFVVLLDSSHHSSTNAADDEVTSIVRSSMLPPHVLTAAIVTTIVTDATSAPVPRGGTEPVLHNIFRDFASIGEANQDVVGPSHLAGTELSTDSFFVSQDVDSKTFHQTCIPKWNVTNDSALDDFDICRGVIDHLAPPAFFSQLYSMDYE